MTNLTPVAEQIVGDRKVADYVDARQNPGHDTHSMPNLAGYVVRNSDSDVASVDGATNYADALDIRNQMPGIYARIDHLFTCGCRAWLV